MENKFRFKNYEFRYNPDRFQIMGKRNLISFQTPLQKTVIQDLGFTPIVVSGRGELCGDDFMESYTGLQSLFLDKNSGLLYIPELVPICCFFSKLVVVGCAGPKYLTYEFEFMEDCEYNVTEKKQVTYYIAKVGDTLYFIAAKFHINVSELIRKNPHITSALDIKEGTTIWL